MVKYTLTETDKSFINFMIEEFNMTPEFNEDGFYSFSMKAYPSTKNAFL